MKSRFSFLAFVILSVIVACNAPANPPLSEGEKSLGIPILAAPIDTPSSKSLFARILIYLLVPLLFACNVLVNTPAQATQLLPTIVQSTPREQPSSTLLPTNTPSVTPTKIVTNTPTDMPTSTPTNTRTSTPTKTPLPPLPDFEDVLSFSPGSGGGVCPGVDSTSNSIQIMQLGQHIYGCFWLWGIDFNKPFQFFLSQVDNPNGVYLKSPNLYFDSNNGKMQWEGYPIWDEFGHGYGDSNGALFVYDFGVWSPVPLSPGQWRFSVVQKGSTFGEFWSDFWVEKEDIHPSISAVNSLAKTEVMPLGLSTRHLLGLKDNGKIDVIGADFPPNTPIYVLLYRKLSSLTGEMVLISKQVVQANSYGSITTELSGPFDPGQDYLVVGVSDPNTRLVDEYGNLNGELPRDYFEVISQILGSAIPNSCPGAPPQRMIVNQRGYVCTQSDSVRLREGPARSANVLVQLLTGSQFTVIGGPSCSDNWSWWQIQTDNGYTGWISEGGGDAVDPYFICPFP